MGGGGDRGVWGVGGRNWEGGRVSSCGKSGGHGTTEERGEGEKKSTARSPEVGSNLAIIIMSKFSS